MRISLFGNLRISIDDRQVTTVNTNRLQSLLAYLVLHCDTPVPRERLAYSLWPASAESQARTNLRQLLHHLKRAVPNECDALQSDHFAVWWVRESPCVVDALEFRAAKGKAANARKSGDFEAETKFLREAARLYEDDLLPALYDEWLSPIRDSYRRQLTEVLNRLATILEGAGQFSEAIPLAERLVNLDSLCETHHRMLIRLHDANDDRAGALRAYHRCMRVLRREMGVDPDRATQDLFDRILQAGPERPVSAPKPEPELQKVGTLIGRGREWKRLASVCQKATDGSPRVAVISGEPGIGKTKLADQFYLSWLGQGLAAARARCYSGQGQLSYTPIAEWLSSDAVSAALGDLPPAQKSELARLKPELMELESPRSRSLDERWQRLEFYGALNATLSKVRKPILLFLDDIQWCDTDSLDWLNAALTSSAATGVFLLVTARSDETDRGHPFTEFMSRIRQSVTVLDIPLEPLDAAESAELARMESSTALDTESVEEIFRDTRGNPLFIVESIRAGLSSSRVYAVIAARLAKLTQTSYELAGLVGVIGRPFSFELLQRATDWDESSVASALDELWQRRIIESRGASEYDFTHDRVREVAHSELSLVRRRYWHRRTARALIDVYRADLERWNGQIAAHFDQAEMAVEAIDYYSRAAASARRRYAESEAANLMRRALTLCERLPETDRRLKQELGLLADLGLSVVRIEGYSAPELGETYRRALALSKRLDNDNLFVNLIGLWVFHTVCGDLEYAKQLGLDFMREAEKNPTPALALAGNFLMGCTLFHLGDLRASLKHMTAAAAAQDAPAEPVLTLFAGPDLRVFCRSYLSQLAWHQGDEEAADLHSKKSIAMARQFENPFGEAIALNYAAMLQAFRGDTGAALKCGREAVELCAGRGFAYYLAMAEVLTGWALAAEGDVAGGLLQLKGGLESMRRRGAELRLPYYCALAAETYMRAGLPGEALASLSTGFAFASKNAEEWAVAELHRVHGELLASEGKFESARAAFGHGAEAARRSGSVAFERKSAPSPSLKTSSGPNPEKRQF